MWQAWINIIVGAWVFLSSFVHNANVAVNFFIVGIIIAIFGFWTPRKKWQGYINGFIGLWLILSGFFLALQASTNLWITGLIVVILASWRAYDVSHNNPSVTA